MDGNEGRGRGGAHRAGGEGGGKEAGDFNARRQESRVARRCVLPALHAVVPMPMRTRVGGPSS